MVDLKVSFNGADTSVNKMVKYVKINKVASKKYKIFFR